MSKFRTGDYPLVAIQTFIEATRDSGYKSTASALSELVDNPSRRRRIRCPSACPKTQTASASA